MNRVKLILVSLILLTNCSKPLEETITFNSPNLKVYFDKEGDLIYQKTGEEPNKIPAEIHASALLDVTSDGKWIVFHKNLNAFLFNTVNESVNQLSLNLDPHYSDTYTKMEFSPDNKYLSIEMQKDGLGGQDIRIYDLDAINFEQIQHAISEFNQSEGQFFPIDDGILISKITLDMMQKNELQPLASGPTVDVFQPEWKDDHTLTFFTQQKESKQWQLDPKSLDLSLSSH